MSVALRRVAVLLVLAGSLLGGPVSPVQAQESTVLVCFVTPFDQQGVPIQIFPRTKGGPLTDRAIGIRPTLSPRAGVFAVAVPLNVKVILMFRANGRLIQSAPEDLAASASPYTGPWTLSITPDFKGGHITGASSRDTGRPVGTVGYIAVCEDEEAAVREDLKNALVMVHGASIPERDCVLWTFEYLRWKHRDAKDAKLLDTVEAAWKSVVEDASAKQLFTGAEVDRKRARYRKLVAASDGSDVALAGISNEEVQSAITDEEAFLPARDAALRVYALEQKKNAVTWELDERTWGAVKRFATSPGSPFLYSANLACASSPAKQQQNIVLENVRNGDGAIFDMALTAAADTHRGEVTEAAGGIAIERANKLSGGDIEKKKAVVDFLSRKPSKDRLDDFAAVLEKFAKDNDPFVAVPATTRLKILHDTMGLKLSKGVQDRLKAISVLKYRNNTELQWNPDSTDTGKFFKDP